MTTFFKRELIPFSICSCIFFYIREEGLITYIEFSNIFFCNWAYQKQFIIFYIPNINKNNFKLFEIIRKEESDQRKKELKSDYIRTNQRIKELNKQIKETSESINLTLTIAKPKIETTGIEIKEEEPKKEEPKEEPKKVDEEEIDKALDDIMDIDKFQKRKDKFTQKEYKECQESISWKKLIPSGYVRKYIYKIAIQIKLII